LKNKLAGLSEFIDADNQEFLIHVLTNQDAQERWCVYTHSSSANRCQEEIASALRLAIEALNERYGTDHTDWTWKRAHISTAHHPLFGRLPFFSKLFDIDTARDGGSDTVNISGHRFDDQALIYKEEVAPTFRAIYDLANQNSVIFSLNSGQSGHFLSPYYKNLSTDWINGRYFTVYTDRNAISQNAMARLTISPSMK
jgi:penicillin amidase